ncbi:MAG: hypothetical protein IPN18_21025 [Ignavibacteriales bacterium]|nr:hypothetical protein [Ignavibacteriales bacterium]
MIKYLDYWMVYNNPDSKRRFVQKQSNFSKIPGSPIAYWVSERLGNTFVSKKKLTI